jgi:hypothetical protein
MRILYLEGLNISNLTRWLVGDIRGQPCENQREQALGIRKLTEESLYPLPDSAQKRGEQTQGQVFRGLTFALLSR